MTPTPHQPSASRVTHSLGLLTHPARRKLEVDLLAVDRALARGEFDEHTALRLKRMALSSAFALSAVSDDVEGPGAPTAWG